MYIPYRKAYLTGMNPLSFITFFSFGELGMMTALSVGSLGLAPLWRELLSARSVIFWLMLGGFVWVIGDIFQQYAAKYVGISRGIPLSNSNQLWGLLWGILVFGELHGRTTSIYLEVIGGSLLMMVGVGAVAFSSATGPEQTRWKEAALRESDRYGVAADFVEARMDGRQLTGELKPSRSSLDWLLVIAATSVFVIFAALARVPQMSLHLAPASLLTAVLFLFLIICGLALWRTTRFH
jgi:drug/metabolite transporter (DMT)-like permease